MRLITGLTIIAVPGFMKHRFVEPDHLKMRVNDGKDIGLRAKTTHG